MFEIHVGELRATFLRNHNMRRHKDPSGRHPRQKTPQAQQTEDPQARNTTQAEDNSSTEDPRNPDSRHNRHKHGGAAPVMWRCTRYVALHPLCGGAPVTWRCTRTEEVHCLRIGCSAPTYKNKRGTGTPNHSPPHPSMRTWTLLAAGWAHRPRHHLHSDPLRPTPTHSDPLRHLLHPYMRRARLPSPSHAEKGVGPGVSSGAHPQSVRIRPASRRRCARGTWPAAR